MSARVGWLIGACCVFNVSSTSGLGIRRARPAFALANPPALRSNTSSQNCLYTRTVMSAGDTFSDLAFGPKITVPGSHIFYQSVHSVAFVNLKPIVPGHVLVVPKRSVPRDNELTDEEVNCSSNDPI